MNDSQISVRYARALFKSALDSKELDLVYQDMKLVLQTCEIAELKEMLDLPTLKGSEKQKLIAALLEKHISSRSMALINLVVSNRREAFLSGIARNYEQIYRRHKGIRSATLRTATQLDEEALEGIRDLIIKAYDSEVELGNTVDEKLLGGFILTIDDRQYDASLSSGLRRIRKELLETRIEKK